MSVFCAECGEEHSRDEASCPIVRERHILPFLRELRKWHAQEEAYGPCAQAHPQYVLADDVCMIARAVEAAYG